MNAKNLKFYFTATLLIAVFISAAIGLILTLPEPSVDTVFVNYVTQKHNDGVNVTENLVYDYTAFDFYGNVLYSTVETKDAGYFERVNEAVKNNDVTVDAKDGKIVFYTSAPVKTLQRGALLNCVWLLVGLALCLLALLSIHGMWIRARMIRPFEKLEYFAAAVAKGDFDRPLQMDRNRNFGAFTEAFEILRDNLNIARKNESRAILEKRELIAALNHDFKTPLSSIRAVAELNQAKKNAPSMSLIIEKINQIDGIWEDLSKAAAKDLKRLDVRASAYDAFNAQNLLRVADYRGKVRISAPPPTVKVSYDALRLGEVFDNLLANSYKYADTEIRADFTVEHGYLKITLTDDGDGVPKDELPRLTEKFYRGQNSSDKAGAGLGLYLCSDYLERMGGKLELSSENGFEASVFLAVC